MAEIEDWSVAVVDRFYIALFSALEQTVVAGPTLPGPCPCPRLLKMSLAGPSHADALRLTRLKS